MNIHTHEQLPHSLFSKATFHIPLTKTKTLNRLLHCSLWRFSGALFYFQGLFFAFRGQNLPEPPCIFSLPPPLFFFTSVFQQNQLHVIWGKEHLLLRQFFSTGWPPPLLPGKKFFTSLGPIPTCKTTHQEQQGIVVLVGKSQTEVLSGEELSQIPSLQTCHIKANGLGTWRKGKLIYFFYAEFYRVV